GLLNFVYQDFSDPLSIVSRERWFQCLVRLMQFEDAIDAGNYMWYLGARPDLRYYGEAYASGRGRTPGGVEHISPHWAAAECAGFQNLPTAMYFNSFALVQFAHLHPPALVQVLRELRLRRTLLPEKVTGTLTSRLLGPPASGGPVSGLRLGSHCLRVIFNRCASFDTWQAAAHQESEDNSLG
ncbi:unnamed protein product, partial [Symbiodinium sp. CCMP2456]